MRAPAAAFVPSCRAELALLVSQPPLTPAAAATTPPSVAARACLRVTLLGVASFIIVLLANILRLFRYAHQSA
jgi:hypothetical protein